MPERFLGIDTSNYRTSAAVYDASSGAWRNEGGLLSVPEGAIGLRQSDALFQHTVRLHEKIEALPQGCLLYTSQSLLTKECGVPAERQELIAR